MQLVVGFLTGLVVGLGFAGILFVLMKERINDAVKYNDARIEDYKDAFSKGYESVNHHAPFVEQKEAGVFDPDERILWEMENAQKNEIEEIEYEERID